MKVNKYYFKNKNKILKSTKQYALKHPIKVKRWKLKSYLKNKNKLKKYRKKYWLINKKKLVKIHKKYYLKNKKRCKKLTKKWVMKNVYNLTKKQYKGLLIKQNNQCVICDKKFTQTPCIDHDHISGKVRGLLCRKHNAALGAFDDNIELLNNAIKYLKGKI